MYKHFIKRAADLIIAFIAAVMLIPVWLILSLLIVIDDRGSVFFVQKRVGKGKKLFPILKFRTMKTKTPHDTPTHSSFPTPISTSPASADSYAKPRLTSFRSCST